jgi:hypothetical protein
MRSILGDTLRYPGSLDLWTGKLSAVARVKAKTDKTVGDQAIGVNSIHATNPYW